MAVAILRSRINGSPGLFFLEITPTPLPPHPTQEKQKIKNMLQICHVFIFQLTTVLFLIRDFYMSHVKHKFGVSKTVCGIFD